MKIIQIDGGQIQTPWMNKEEAARYCGISLEKFRQLNKKLPCPHACTSSCARYHQDVLDEWYFTLSEGETSA